MKKFFLLLLAASLLISSATFSEYVPDDIGISGYYFSYISGYYYILHFYGLGFSSGQVSVCKLKDVLHEGPTPDLFIPDAYYETTGSGIVIKEGRFSENILASGTAGSGFLDLTLDNENCYHFVFLPSNAEITIPSDSFADVRPLFDEGFTVPAGLYVVGEDLPSGAFSFSSESGCKIDIQQNNYNHFVLSLSPGESFARFELIDHQLLLVTGGAVTLKTYTGLFDR